LNPANNPAAAAFALPTMIEASQAPLLPGWARPQNVSQIDLNANQTLCWCASLARASYAPSNVFVQQLAQALFGPGGTVTFVANSSSLIPGWSVIVLPNMAVVVISGTSNEAQALTQVIDNQAVYTNFDPNGRSSALSMPLWITAVNTLAPLINALVPADVPKLFIGHSYGGAVAALLNYYYQFNGSLGTNKAALFACPKPGNAIIAPEVDSFSSFQSLAIQPDLVPGLPPNLGLLGYAAPAPIAAAAAYWAQFATFGNQQQLNEDGSTAYGYTPSLLPAVAQVLLQLAAGSPLSLVSAHQIATFVNYLRASFVNWTARDVSGWYDPTLIDAANASMTAAGL
jgi:pimeloyl-ACP methyl ester carboxylesterase